MNTFMNKEDYVSIETAKLLKEKNFNWITNRSFLASGVFAPCDITEVPINENNIRIPTLQMTMKWLREVHNLFISIQHHVSGSYVWYIYETIYQTSKGCDRENNEYSYEEACEAAIEYCLENLV